MRLSLPCSLLQTPELYPMALPSPPPARVVSQDRYTVAESNPNLEPQPIERPLVTLVDQNLCSLSVQVQPSPKAAPRFQHFNSLQPDSLVIYPQVWLDTPERILSKGIRIELDGKYHPEDVTFVTAPQDGLRPGREFTQVAVQKTDGTRIYLLESTCDGRDQNVVLRGDYTDRAFRFQEKDKYGALLPDGTVIPPRYDSVRSLYNSDQTRLGYAYLGEASSGVFHLYQSGKPLQIIEGTLSSERIAKRVVSIQGKHFATFMIPSSKPESRALLVVTGEKLIPISDTEFELTSSEGKKQRITEDATGELRLARQ